MIVACAALALATEAGAQMQAGDAASFVPADDAMILEQLVGRRDAAARDLRTRRVALQARPNDAGAAAAYVRAAVALGRAQGDPRYFGYAESALAPWAGAATPPDEIAWLQAVLLQQHHDFDGAATLLDRLLARSDYPPAHLTRAALRMVRGQPRAALSDCMALTRLAVETTTVCVAASRSLTGQAASALTGIAGVAPRLAADERVWALTTAAEIATRITRWDVAQASFDAAFAELARRDEQDPYLLVAYADFLLERDRPAEVIALLREQRRIDTALLRLALAEQISGDAALAAHRQELAARFAAVRERGDTTHGREEARFALDLQHDPAVALQLARDNWQVQREPADAGLLLRSALAARDPAAAKPVLDWMQETGIEDPALHRLRAALQKVPP